LQNEFDTAAMKYSTIPIAKVIYPPVLKNMSNPTIAMPRERTVSNVLANMSIPNKGIFKSEILRQKGIPCYW
jgi:hypothetical protein